MSKIRLRPTIAILLVVLLFVSLVLNATWSNFALKSQAEREMLEKSQILASQMEASWEFVDINQERIDTDSDGSYNFKGIYCAISGKGIGKLFFRKTGYIIRYVNINPRQVTASPDEFERKAFESFESGVTEHYAITTYENKDVFRYVTPLYITESCLKCHGEPAGEIDVTGFPKEGAKVGGVGGAISIVMPIDLYMSSIQSNVLQQTGYFFVIISLFVLVVYFVLARFVTKPLTRLEATVEQVEKGNLAVDLNDIPGTIEIQTLASKFSSMARQMQTLYSDLETQVEIRTNQLESANSVLKQQSCKLEEVNNLLADANRSLQDESQYKSDFLAIMSHELRTPLTSILAFTDIWEKTDYEKDGRETMAIQEIKENSQILLQMVNNILEAARAEAGRTEMHLESIDMVDLVGCVKGTLAFLAEKKNVILTVTVHDDVPIITADWEKLRRIIENLTSNAIKFTRCKGSVSIEVSYQEEKDCICIQVRDNGIGIKVEDMPYIFDKFVQNDQSAHRRYNGSGLGLAVVKELVEAHQGTVLVESAFKQGSVFTVCIPAEVTDQRSVQ